MAATTTPGLTTLNTATAPAEVPEEKAPLAQVQTKGGRNSNLVGTIPMNADDTDALLARMQKFVDDREGPMASLARGLSLGMATARGPSALTAMQREQSLQDKQMMDYQQTMGEYRAAGEAAKRNAEDYAAKMGSAGGAGGTAKTGTYGGVPMDDLIKAQLNGQPAHDTPILEAWLKTKSTEKIKGENNPASLTRQPVVIMNPNTKQPEVRDVNMYEYWDLKSKNLIKQPSEYYESQGKPTAAPAATAPVTTAPAEVAPIAKAVYSTESSSGANAKPSIQGALGPMQITPDTWETNVKRGVIPADYDINNPEQNKDAGDRILAYYNTKFKGDTDKVLAAYHGGEGAINPDGSINLDRKDALGTTIRSYIDMNKAKMEPNQVSKDGVQLASNNQGFPDVANILAQRKIAEEEGTAAAKERGKSGEEKRTAFETDIAPTTIIEDKETNKRIQTLVKESPEITGVLAGEGYAKAVAGQLERGIGNISVNDLSTAILQTLPTTTNLTMARRNELATYLARMELKAAKLIKGQGQITEGEREILKHASSSTKDPAEAVYKKAKMLERIADLNDELSKIYGNGSKFQNFRDFNTDPRVIAIHQRYQKDLEGILNEKVDFSRAAPGANSKSGPKEGDVKPTPSGKTADFKNGLWVYKK